MRIIWAYHDLDPDSEEMTYANYHGATARGSRSIQLINFIDTSITLPPDSFPIDLMAQNVSISMSGHIAHGWKCICVKDCISLTPSDAYMRQ